MAETTRRPLTLASFSLVDKVCMVTGAARGLGLEFCRAFLGSGCTSLVLLDLKESDLKSAVDKLHNYCDETLGHKPEELTITSIECNVTSEENLVAAYDKIIRTHGRIDVTVACAGIVENFSALDYPTERLKVLFDVNVNGVFYTAREAARHMIPQKSGSIILVASMSANIVNIPQMQTPYNASKAAVKHMAASLAVEWAQHGIRVNSLSPGYMLTKLTRTILEGDPELKNTWEKLTPLGRMGEPEDLAASVQTDSFYQPDSDHGADFEGGDCLYGKRRIELHDRVGD